MSLNNTNNNSPLDTWDDDVMWDNIASELDQDDRKPFILWFGMALLLMGMGYGLFSFLNDEDSAKSLVSETTHELVEEANGVNDFDNKSLDIEDKVSSNNQKINVQSTGTDSENINKDDLKEDTNSEFAKARNNNRKNNISPSKQSRNNTSQIIGNNPKNTSNSYLTQKSNLLKDTELLSTPSIHQSEKSSDIFEYDQASAVLAFANDKTYDSNAQVSVEKIQRLLAKLEFNSEIPELILDISLVGPKVENLKKKKSTTFFTQYVSVGQFQFENDFSELDFWASRKQANEKTLYSIGTTFAIHKPITKSLNVFSGFQYGRFVSIMEDEETRIDNIIVPSDSAIIITADQPLYIAGELEVETTTNRTFKVYNKLNQISIPFGISYLKEFDKQSVLISVSSSLRLLSALKGYSVTQENLIESYNDIEADRKHIRLFNDFQFSLHYTRKLYKDFDLLVGGTFKKANGNVYKMTDTDGGTFEKSLKDYYHFDIGVMKKF